jgi:hypothetical protein
MISQMREQGAQNGEAYEFEMVDEAHIHVHEELFAAEDEELDDFDEEDDLGDRQYDEEEREMDDGQDGVEITAKVDEDAPAHADDT